MPEDDQWRALLIEWVPKELACRPCWLSNLLWKPFFHTRGPTSILSVFQLVNASDSLFWQNADSTRDTAARVVVWEVISKELKIYYFIVRHAKDILFWVLRLKLARISLEKRGKPRCLPETTWAALKKCLYSAMKHGIWILPTSWMICTVSYYFSILCFHCQSPGFPGERNFASRNQANLSLPFSAICQKKQYGTICLIHYQTASYLCICVH